MKYLYLTLLISFPFYTEAQICNKLGVWMWHLEITGFNTHYEAADSLSNMGIKRIYVKVADGSVNTNNWPELIDNSLISAYHEADMEVWAWSYNYPNNNEAQAEALYIAAQTGFDGYVIDVEMQFDNKPIETENLFVAFDNARNQAISDFIIGDEFKIYCTTWGNPKDHLFAIDKIDPYVDGFMPQTYVEIWGESFLENITFWIEEGNEEYAELGATKPIHHITAMESGQMTSDQVNEFMIASGSETSIWRIPGGGTPLSIWDQWEEIEWGYDFCSPSNTVNIEPVKVKIYPNPASSILNLTNVHPESVIEIINSDGSQIKRFDKRQNQIDVSSLPSGMYFINIYTSEITINHKFVVSH